MTITCPCGGVFRRSDLAMVFDRGHALYQDTDPLAAHWSCSRCGRERKQRKRQPKRLIRKAIEGDING